jgi:MFS family permease
LKRDPGKIGIQALGESESTRIKVGNREIGLTFLEAVRTRAFWIACVVYTLYGFYVQGVMVHIVPYAKTIGIDGNDVVWILPCLGFGSILGRIGGGSVSDRIGVKYTLLIGLAAILVSFIWLWFVDSVWMIYLFAAVYGFGYGTLIAMQTLVPARLFGLISIGTLAGIVVFVYTVGGTVGPIITGYIYDITGSYRIAIIIFAALAGGGLFATLFLRRDKVKPIDNKIVSAGK